MNRRQLERAIARLQRHADELVRELGLLDEAPIEGSSADDEQEDADA